MQSFKFLAVGAAALIAFQTQPGFAHHSYAMFDMDKNVTLDGTVKEVQWTNPHIWIQMVVKDPATGKDVEWSIEGASPNMLSRAGWTRSQLKAGDKAVIVVHPVRNVENGNSGSLASLTVNGQKVYGGQNPNQPAEAK